MNYLKISNEGAIDKNALMLLGASSKREDKTKIGMFGSGNKYALAYLLRNAYEVMIFSGLQEIKLTTVEKEFRGDKFQVIAIDGTETSITTDFGKDWQLWQAIRELYCNALDEGKAVIEYVMNPTPQEGYTHFYIKTRSEITNFVTNFSHYFADNRKVLFQNENGRILEKVKEDGKLSLFRKGIRCFKTDKLSVYDYDLNEISIDENRIVSYSWTVPSRVWELIYACTDKEVIKNILFKCSESHYIECIGSDFANINSHLMSKEYIEVLNEIKMAPREMSGLISMDEIGDTVILPSAIFDHAKAVVTNDNLAHKFKVYKGEYFVESVGNELYIATLKKAMQFLKECEYEINYPVVFASFQQKKILGMADTNEQRIILSDICMEKGVQAVIQTLIEEYIHLKYQVKDETRSFQNAAISEIVNLLKVHHAYLV